MRKPDGKNANGRSDRGQQLSVIAQENLKLAVFLFRHQWRCIFDWESTRRHSISASRTDLNMSKKT